VVKVAECLLSKCEALSSNLRTEKIWFFFLLAYIYCGGGLLWQFWIALCCTLVWLPHPSPLPTFSLSHLKQLQEVSLFYFLYEYEAHQPYCFIFISCTQHPPHVLYLFYSFVFQYESQSQCSKGFLDASQLWICFTLIVQAPLPSTHYYSAAFSTYHYVIYLHGCEVFQYCWLSFSFSFLPPSSSIV
jgi:hypothetical protein